MCTALTTTGSGGEGGGVGVDEDSEEWAAYKASWSLVNNSESLSLFSSSSCSSSLGWKL